jgi:hypothetical protein
MTHTIASVLRANDKSPSISDQINAKIEAAFAEATDDDKARVDALIAKAIAHSPDDYHIEKVEYTPGMMALIIINHNKRNRDWDPEHVQNLADDMANKRWLKNIQGYSWYVDGNWADGGQRARAQISSNTTLVMPTFFSMRPEDIGSIDCGRLRRPWQIAAFDGVTNGPKKQELLESIWAYERRLNIPNSVAIANSQAVADEIKRNDKLLQRALDIGIGSLADAECPVSNENWAARIAALTLRHGWPAVRLQSLLEEIQVGEFEEDSKSPLAKARNWIDGNRPIPPKINAQHIMNVIIKAMIMTENGVTVTRKMTEFITAGKNYPNPDYPVGEKDKEAAE